MIDVSWVKLRKECPVDIKEIIKLASQVDSGLDPQLSKNFAIVDDACSKLIRTMGKMLILFHNKKFLPDKDSEKHFAKFIEDFSRLYGFLDDFWKDNIKGIGVDVLIERDTYRAYIMEMQNVLSNVIYEPLKKATDDTNERFKDKETDENGVTKTQFFFNKVFEVTAIQVATLGGKSRKGEKEKTFGFSSPETQFPHADEMGGQRMKDDRTLVVQDVASEAAKDAGLVNDLMDVLSQTS